MRTLVSRLFGFPPPVLSEEARLIIESLESDPSGWWFGDYSFRRGAVTIWWENHMKSHNRPPVSRYDWDMIRRAARVAIVKAVVRSRGAP